MRYGAHTRLRDLLADPRAVAVLEKHVPGATNHPQLHMALDMSLSEIATYPEAGLTTAKFQALIKELSEL